MKTLSRALAVSLVIGALAAETTAAQEMALPGPPDHFDVQGWPSELTAGDAIPAFWLIARVPAPFQLTAFPLPAPPPPTVFPMARDLFRDWINANAAALTAIVAGPGPRTTINPFTPAGGAPVGGGPVSLPILRWQVTSAAGFPITRPDNDELSLLGNRWMLHDLAVPTDAFQWANPADASPRVVVVGQLTAATGINPDRTAAVAESWGPGQGPRKITIGLPAFARLSDDATSVTGLDSVHSLVTVVQGHEATHSLQHRQDQMTAAPYPIVRACGEEARAAGFSGQNVFQEAQAYFREKFAERGAFHSFRDLQELLSYRDAHPEDPVFARPDPAAAAGDLAPNIPGAGLWSWCLEKLRAPPPPPGLNPYPITNANQATLRAWMRKQIYDQIPPEFAEMRWLEFPTFDNGIPGTPDSRGEMRLAHRVIPFHAEGIVPPTLAGLEVLP